MKSDQIAVVLDRFLQPAEYQARVKVADLNGTSEAIVEQIRSRCRRSRSASATRSTEIKDKIESHAPSIRILPLGDELLSGMQHIETDVEGKGITAVEFYLDGQKVMSKRQPPYALDLDFGSVPQVHRIRVLALDDKRER